MRIMMNEQAFSPAERQHLIYRFLYENTNKDHVVSTAQIFDYLFTYDIKTSINTFYADIQAIMATEKVSIAYNNSKKGYYLESQQFEPRELRMIVDSIQASQFIPQKDADIITEKIISLTDRYTASKLKRQAYVANRVRNVNESVVKESEKIYEAIATNSKIFFRYFHRTPNRSKAKRYTKEGERLIVSPFAMLWDSGRYYLYAYDGKRFRTYRIDRMEGIAYSKEKRDGIEEYNAKNLTRQKATVFDMYHGKEYNISFRCHNQIADAVIDKFGDHVLLIPDGDSHFTFTAPIEVSPPFYAWVATFGRSIKITSPAGAIKEMKEFLQKASEMYKDEAEM